MMSRAESSAATRASLVRAASDLLREGGRPAVTLRAVGARAGVTRGAPYVYWVDKEALLLEIAVAGWTRYVDELHQLRGKRLSAQQRLERALVLFVRIASEEPHLYALMFSTPSDDREDVVQAAASSQAAFLEIVGDAVGADQAQHYGALLMSAAHGIADMGRSGHLSKDKWSTTPAQLISTLVTSVGAAATHGPAMPAGAVG